ncbi:IucA/IucC family protein [Zobellella denitrificans]|uniref:IucA/IucC family protein n=1 Tax=Zobellella denitrificans TaxID=347534 RepID=A0A291HT78_9GAMM|nr:IucA/IucC family siderophore biosynthesis protein [Zobellella denitrificans]ATG75387.1 IucA/IucC family protein [Zobellella denitrificans]
MTAQPFFSPAQAVVHLQPERWARVNRLHLRKALSEFSHERLLAPEWRRDRDGWGHYRLAADEGEVEYRFRARLLSLEHWDIDAESIEKRVAGAPAPLDSLSFIAEFQHRLGIADAMLPTYMEEITSTLYGSAYKHAKGGPLVAELLEADFQQVEAAMMEGHPAFVANNGRIGFDGNDYAAYAPEAASPVSLIWIGVHKSRARFACLDELSYEQLLRREFDPDTLAAFDERLAAQVEHAADYLLMPVHPWQWHNKVVSIFSPDIAARHIVYLGTGPDAYQAQQSIRTFFNLSRPDRHYVKMALSILNMGFMRGLSPYYMSATPAINQWLHALLAADPYFAAKGFTMLREVASIGYRHSHYDQAVKQDSPYKKMLSALWRESPLPQAGPGQRLMTMAALLHVDQEGRALLPALIEASGLDGDDWLRRYLDCYLSPLLHAFYTYDLAFMPHGENLILVLDGQVPVKAIMKDIAEEIAVLDPEATLPEGVRRIAVSVPDELKLLSIFTDVFDGIFRYLNQILVAHAGYPEQRFWELVADCARAYQQAHPHLAEKFARYDLFAPEFLHSCLNRLQLGNNQQMINLADPAQNLKFAGNLANPIAPFRP